MTGWSATRSWRLIPAQAERVDVGKEGFGPSTPQGRDINAILVAEAQRGLRVVRLKGGDCGIFGRLDEEIDALQAAGLAFRILPGLTTASVAAAAIGQSLTKRGRNSGLRIVTGHDMAGFAERDWRGLAAPSPPIISARPSAVAGPSNYFHGKQAEASVMYDHSEFDRAFSRPRRPVPRAGRTPPDGSLTEDEFRPLRLMNGVYLQLHAYMLRVAIPLWHDQPRPDAQLALIASKWDKGYGHFTTRQNIQFNWPKLVDIPDMLDALADVGMHAIQTSGNTIRNVTADHFAGAAADEIADPRPYAELMRQWSTDHPEFQFLPRKFKIAISGSPNDRAVVAAHDIGLRMVEENGRAGLSRSGRRRSGPHAAGRQVVRELPARGRPAALCRGDHLGL
jgi:hypothetical protein